MWMYTFSKKHNSNALTIAIVRINLHNTFLLNYAINVDLKSEIIVCEKFIT